MIEASRPMALPKLLVVEDDAGLQRQLRWAYEGYEVCLSVDNKLYYAQQNGIK